MLAAIIAREFFSIVFSYLQTSVQMQTFQCFANPEEADVESRILNHLKLQQE